MGIKADQVSICNNPQQLSQIGCRVYNSANISISNATLTAITFDSERYDTDNIHSTSSNTSRLTANRAGKYIISGGMAYASNSTGQRFIAVRVNGATYIDVHEVLNIGANNHSVSISTIYHLNVGDYVELIAYQTSGGALNVLTSANDSPEFEMTLIQQ